MKKIINISRAIILIACIVTLSSGNGRGATKWQQERGGSVGFSIGNLGYIGTGYGYIRNAFGCKKDFWEYNPATDAWTQKADFGGEARADATGFSLGNKGYIGTGYIYGSTTHKKDFWEYNPAANTWIRKADFGGDARRYAAGFSICTATTNKGYIGTGAAFDLNPPQNFQDFWEYDPVTDTWLQKADFPGTARYAAAGFGIGEKGYLGSGINYVSSTEVTFYKDFYEYDPVADTWIRKADIGGLDRAFAVGFSVGSKGYIGTGNSPGTSPGGLQNDFWEYNPAGDTWIQKANFGGAKRSIAAGFSIGTKGYIGTGCISAGTYSQDFWEYSQTNNLWTKKTNLGQKPKGQLKESDATEVISPAVEADLMVYPNPASNLLNIGFDAPTADEITVKFTELSGSVISTYTFNPMVGKNNYSIDLRETANGIYFMVLTSNGQNYCRKIIINK